LVYKYKLPKKPAEPRALNRLSEDSAQEILTGLVQGKTASDIEERFAKSLYRRNIRFEFQVSFIAGMNMPGEIRLDFLIIDNFVQPVQIDGEFAHKTSEQKARDNWNDAILNDRLVGTGALPVIRIDGEYMQTQEDSNKELDKIL